MVKPWKFVEFAEVALLREIGPRNDVFVEKIALDDVVAARLPAVVLPGPGREVVLLATADCIVVDEATAGGGSVAKP